MIDFMIMVSYEKIFENDLMNYLFITDCFIGNPASATLVNSYFFKKFK